MEQGLEKEVLLMFYICSLCSHLQIRGRIIRLLQVFLLVLQLSEKHTCISFYTIVVFSSVVELIFFTVAGIGLYFEFMMNIGLMIQKSFSFIAEQRIHTFLLFYIATLASRLWMNGKLRRHAVGKVEPSCPKGYYRPYDNMLSK